MYLGTVNFMFLAFFCATTAVFCSPIPTLDQLEPHPNKRSTTVLKFEGCFDDTISKIIKSATKFDAADNNNHVCVSKCSENGFAISSTKGSSCYCTNTLPLSRLVKPNWANASGTDGPCSTACPGTRAARQKIACQEDECCGGPSAYSVYLSGQIDVLKQLLRRVASKLPKKKYSHRYILAGITSIDMDKYYYNEVTASGKSVNSQGIQGIKSCTLRTGDFTGRQTYSCKNLRSLPDKHVHMQVKNLNKLLESQEPIAEKLATNYDVIADNLNGASDLWVTKSLAVKATFSESWSTQSGIDVTTTMGAEFKAGALFASATTTFSLSLGMSFSTGYTKTKGWDVTETFAVRSIAKPGTKVETRFFKSGAPVQVKWRAEIFADGYIHIVDTVLGTKQQGSDKRIIQLLTHDERKFFAFGTIDYGTRKTLIARSKTTDRKGNVINVSVDTKAIK